jgi:hypothetical protein
MINAEDIEKNLNDIFDKVTDPQEVDLKKTHQILVSLGQSWTNI